MGIRPSVIFPQEYLGVLQEGTQGKPLVVSTSSAHSLGIDLLYFAALSWLGVHCGLQPAKIRYSIPMLPCTGVGVWRAQNHSVISSFLNAM